MVIFTSNQLNSNPTIVLIGVDSKIKKILESYLDCKYQFFQIERDFDIELLAIYPNTTLFLMSTDQPFISIEESVKLIKEHPHYQNIPVLGMVQKNHYPHLTADEKVYFEDILLMPINYEDMLTRIEVWTSTYRALCNDAFTSTSITLNEINCKEN
jgi:hypothetical protein